VPRPSSASRLARILTALEGHYGPVRATKPARPYDLLLYANCGYPASERACQAGFAALKGTVGLSPKSILSASEHRLVEAMRAGGIVPELRATRIREIARRSATEPGSNPNLVAKLPIAKARKLLKTFPTIGDPGADRILLLSHTEAIAAVPSNATQVPLRLGFGKEQSSYAAGYRSAQAALDAALPRTAAARIRAYVLLKKHGEETCKRSRPQCERCPVASDCPFPGREPRLSERSARSPS
jgi:endonuclease III